MSTVSSFVLQKILDSANVPYNDTIGEESCKLINVRCNLIKKKETKRLLLEERADEIL